jgi:hypothetical protein
LLLLLLERYGILLIFFKDITALLHSIQAQISINFYLLKDFVHNNFRPPFFLLVDLLKSSQPNYGDVKFMKKLRIINLFYICKLDEQVVADVLNLLYQLLFKTLFHWRACDFLVNFPVFIYSLHILFETAQS